LYEAPVSSSRGFFVPTEVQVQLFSFCCGGLVAAEMASEDEKMFGWRTVRQTQTLGAGCLMSDS
jgi:hypothetical protein